MPPGSFLFDLKFWNKGGKMVWRLGFKSREDTFLLTLIGTGAVHYNFLLPS